MDLYKGAFSLAYGTLTLLRDAKMHLKRNRSLVCIGDGLVWWTGWMPQATAKSYGLWMHVD